MEEESSNQEESDGSTAEADVENPDEEPLDVDGPRNPETKILVQLETYLDEYEEKENAFSSISAFLASGDSNVDRIDHALALTTRLAAVYCKFDWCVSQSVSDSMSLGLSRQSLTYGEVGLPSGLFSDPSASQRARMAPPCRDSVTSGGPLNAAASLRISPSAA